MKIGIIGYGNLGSALARGLEKSGCAARENINICDAGDDLNEAIRNSDIIFVVVKSYVFEELAHSIDESILGDKPVISFMAGVSSEKIRSLVRCSAYRAMPSVAIAECEGVIGYERGCPPSVVEILKKLGFAFEAESEDIEKVMAFSGCGLGFAAYLIDAFAQAGQAIGFSAETSQKIAELTFKSAAARGSFAETVRSVATPGGATEQGVLHLNESNVYDTIARAVQRAHERMSG